ncbi:unnamed protein product [Strongylus vulgaris]|uniref:Uncharacterized protein n=1 Tax=Strongylus vulgaris TaxID=40348 RepID=A0A3P7J775_STRVU|nr:unnamed protein product [Strongylus vulgaris]
MGEKDFDAVVNTDEKVDNFHKHRFICIDRVSRILAYYNVIVQYREEHQLMFYLVTVVRLSIDDVIVE